MSITTDRNDPRLTHGADTGPTGQAEVYLALPPEEIAKGYVRPLRTTYRHVGVRPTHETRSLTAQERARYGGQGYVAYEPYPDGSASLGRFWTAAELDSGCGAETTMAGPLAETYAREPGFYGATYCTGCEMHRPVEEFVWLDGSRGS